MKNVKESITKHPAESITKKEMQVREKRLGKIMKWVGNHSSEDEFQENVSVIGIEVLKFVLKIFYPSFLIEPIAELIKKIISHDVFDSIEDTFKSLFFNFIFVIPFTLIFSYLSEEAHIQWIPYAFGIIFFMAERTLFPKDRYKLAWFIGTEFACALTFSLLLLYIL